MRAARCKVEAPLPEPQLDRSPIATAIRKTANRASGMVHPLEIAETRDYSGKWNLGLRHPTSSTSTIIPTS